MIAKRRATFVVFDNSPFDIGIRRPNHSNIEIKFGAYESDAPAESTLKKTKKRPARLAQFVEATNENESGRPPNKQGASGYMLNRPMV